MVFMMTIQKHHTLFCDIEVKGNIDALPNSNAIIAIGDNLTRKNI